MGPIAWPGRKREELDAVIAGTPKVLGRGAANARSFAPQGPRPGVGADSEERGIRVEYSGRHGEGIIRVLVRGGEGGRRWIRFVSISQRPQALADTRMTRWLSTRMAWLEQQLDARPSDEPASGNRDAAAARLAEIAELRLAFEGTGILVMPPDEPEHGRGALGTVVHMAGLGSAAYERPLLEELRRRGWWIVSVSTPRVWWFEERAFHVGSRQRVPEVAAELAAEVDDLLAESAYAAEAAVDYLASRRPEVPLGRMVMLGCSAGALAAPAVVARMPERFSAMVLVGGGANLLEISQTSDLTNAGIALTWAPDAPRGPWRRELFAAYARASALDPYAVAPRLAGKPTLLVQANLDSTVPAHNGWLLWDRLGRPDRYVHTGGHRTLFLTLASQTDRIAAWIERASAAADAGGPTRAGAPR
jgi:pimeloyl-ACP methyl ester carboxylesterase